MLGRMTWLGKTYFDFCPSKNHRKLGNFPNQFLAPASSGQCALFILPACCITKVECFSSCSPSPIQSARGVLFHEKVTTEMNQSECMREKGSCYERPRRVAKIESLHIMILLPTKVEKLGARNIQVNLIYWVMPY